MDKRQEKLRAKRNRVRLYAMLDGELVSHFTLREFENLRGYVTIHPSILLSLEKLRRELCRLYGGEEIEIIVLNAIRTDEDTRRIAARYGWADEGGRVSRDSKHNTIYSGVAVDIKARRKGRKDPDGQVLMGTLAELAAKCFDYVKFYEDHVHADNRFGGPKERG